MAQKRKITDKNLYEFLDVSSSATEQEIKKANRKKALTCHPDKNPDNPKAAELFHELSEALEILTDEKARQAYDRTLKAKELAKERHRELNTKRKKLKEDLERREQAAREDDKARAAAKKAYSANLSEEDALQKEIDRLRKEGSRALQEEQELIRQQIVKDKKDKGSFVYSNNREETVEGPKLKVKWVAKEGHYPKDYDGLMKTYCKYGSVTALVLGKKFAIVEYQNQADADKAYEGESNSTEIQLEWLSRRTSSGEAGSSSSNTNNVPTASKGYPTFPNPTQPMNTSNFADFEAMILGKLSAAVAAQKDDKS